MAELRLAHSPGSASRARWLLHGELMERAVPEDRATDALLVLTELIGNAVRHARPLPDGGVGVRWEYTPTELIIYVRDGGSGHAPRVAHPGPGEPGGRGLAIVQALALNWGVLSECDTTTVWAVIQLQPTQPLTSSTGRRPARSSCPRVSGYR